MDKSINLISVDLIVPNTYQPRQYFDEEAIDELAQSIASYGIIQPLTVRKIADDKYELVAGERRFRAAKKLGLSEVPTVLVDISDGDSAVIALLENLQREDLNFLEEAEAYQNLIKEHNYTQEQLAKIIGKKQSTIANKLRVLKLDKSIRNMLIESNLTERHGRALLKLPSLELQLTVLQKVIKRGLNVKKTEELVELELEALKDIAYDGKKRIKGIFNAKIYMNTIKQVFDKYGINANYKSKELDDCVQVTVTIPKNEL
ncbi:ParB family protein [Clostridium collagenovorans DSM 3089]|uniref:ParB family protein n=1 Tax=Clostridium collagenovorans DSM 3089 TaxID=1121306 RepID=A0A1M5YGV4_9CLOT|nr:nucleoid occlusion protein [Clostridium collagenovorans]SHI11088.1 ParB family protein [Clostridium collagenovorans DSM 3089]